MIPPRVSYLDGFGIILGVELMDLRDVVHAIKAIEAILLTSIGEGGRGWNNWRIDVQRNPPVSSCSSDADLVVESMCCEALSSLAADLSAQSKRQQNSRHHNCIAAHNRRDLCQAAEVAFER